MVMATEKSDAYFLKADTYPTPPAATVVLSENFTLRPHDDLSMREPPDIS
jgi:hypothetical protein